MVIVSVIICLAPVINCSTFPRHSVWWNNVRQSVWLALISQAGKKITLYLHMQIFFVLWWEI